VRILSTSADVMYKKHCIISPIA